MIIKERWYKTVALPAVLSSLLYASSIYLPVIGGFLSFFSPLPVAFIRIKYSKIESYLTFLFLNIVIFFIGGVPAVLLFLLQYGLPILMFSEIFIAVKEPYTAMLFSTCLLIALFYAVFLTYSGFSITKVNLLLQNYIEKSLNLAFKSYSGSLSKAELIEISEKLKKTVYYIIKILPSLMFMFYSAVMIGNFYIVKRLIPELNRIELTKFQAPFFVVWLFIISGFFVLFNKNYFFINIFLICSFLYLIQGLCIIEFWFKKYEVSPFLRGIFLFTIIFLQFVFILIAILGLFDNWFDYRKLNIKEENNESNS